MARKKRRAHRRRYSEEFKTEAVQMLRQVLVSRWPFGVNFDRFNVQIERGAILSSQRVQVR